MKFDPIKVFYVEISALVALTIFCYAITNNTYYSPTVGTCGSSLLRVIPYIYFNFETICGHRVALATLAIYYFMSFATITIAQWFWISGRGRLYIVNKRLFLIVLTIFLFFLYGWVSGRPGSVSVHDARIHQGYIFFPLMASAAIPSFQFILSIMLLAGDKD